MNPLDKQDQFTIQLKNLVSQNHKFLIPKATILKIEEKTLTGEEFQSINQPIDQFIIVMHA